MENNSPTPNDIVDTSYSPTEVTGVDVPAETPDESLQETRTETSESVKRVSSGISPRRSSTFWSAVAAGALSICATDCVPQRSNVDQPAVSQVPLVPLVERHSIQIDKAVESIRANSENPAGAYFTLRINKRDEQFFLQKTFNGYTISFVDQRMARDFGTVRITAHDSNTLINLLRTGVVDQIIILKMLNEGVYKPDNSWERQIISRGENFAKFRVWQRGGSGVDLYAQVNPTGTIYFTISAPGAGIHGEGVRSGYADSIHDLMTQVKLTSQWCDNKDRNPVTIRRENTWREISDPSIFAANANRIGQKITFEISDMYITEFSLDWGDTLGVGVTLSVNQNGDIPYILDYGDSSPHVYEVVPNVQKLVERLEFYRLQYPSKQAKREAERLAGLKQAADQAALVEEKTKADAEKHRKLVGLRSELKSKLNSLPDDVTALDTFVRDILALEPDMVLLQLGMEASKKLDWLLRDKVKLAGKAKGEKYNCEEKNTCDDRRILAPHSDGSYEWETRKSYTKVCDWTFDLRTTVTNNNVIPVTVKWKYDYGRMITYGMGRGEVELWQSDNERLESSSKQVFPNEVKTSEKSNASCWYSHIVQYTNATPNLVESHADSSLAIAKALEKERDVIFGKLSKDLRNVNHALELESKAECSVGGLSGRKMYSCLPQQGSCTRWSQLQGPKKEAAELMSIYGCEKKGGGAYCCPF